ncbi:probable 2-oxoglutarate-dependent dioxygenase AOP1 [Cornus florida]|uniref:probable 2-oxoglutarate-dependent dioxygenase AOP1 n=1 Tax=Cornus florida TaxID=4283 RepID=UPI00289BA3E9|nr:probable 2-oxoglutarate-dependent dioxygenase AOP1 [Cornus florida]
MGSLAQPKLPVIDFCEKNLKPGTNSGLSTRNETVRALEEYGCFVAVYDTVSLDLHNANFQASKQLFDLPTETKKQNTSDTPNHGYKMQQLYKELRNSLISSGPPEMILSGIICVFMQICVFFFFFFSFFEWSINLTLCYLCCFLVSETVLSFSKLASELDQTVKKMVSESYGIQKYHEYRLGSTCYLLKPTKYREPKMNETNIGILPHTDSSFFTILHQYQAWTNGRIESPIHRVIMSSKERYFLGLFSLVRDLLIEIPEEVVDDAHPLQYKPFYHYKLLRFCKLGGGQENEIQIVKETTEDSSSVRTSSL